MAMQWMIRYNPMDLITEGLYLGNVAAASDIKLLQQHGITHILRVLKGDFGKFYYDKFSYKIIQIDDLPNQNIQKYFESSYKFIEDALSANKDGVVKNKVLVHCQVGMSRSATIVISYLMKKYPDLTWNKALRFVKAKRPIVNPNDGFLRQLKAYERTLERLRYKEKLNDSISGMHPPKSPERAQEPYRQDHGGYTREEVKSRKGQSRNYHFSRGVSANGGNRSKTDMYLGYPNTKSDKYQEYKKKQARAQYYQDKSYGNNFLEQNLKMHRPSILQKSGIDVTKGGKVGYSNGGQLNDYSKMFTGHNLKKQQVFSSPMPVTKGSLLPGHGKTYPYIEVPPYIYMSPQRNYSKAGQLLDAVDYSSKQAEAPVYK